eukprot:TRINITY_DN16579_c0_g1_i1.p1 TRINITY_DN16579_c0_g1~~TRINITY_DN16579_c0_g1_i1.p1  ORF type:complete len:746 (+),score=153.47 TRINITY_DN16579_c0_g1_i1:58-2238(+)
MHPQAPAAASLTAMAAVAYCCLSSRSRYASELSKVGVESSDDALREVEACLMRKDCSLYKITRILGVAIEGKIPQDKIDEVATIAKRHLSELIMEILEADRSNTADERFINTMTRMHKLVHGCKYISEALNISQHTLLSEILSEEAHQELDAWLSKQRRFGYSAFCREVSHKAGGRALSLLSSIAHSYIRSATASYRLDLHESQPGLLKDDLISFVKVAGLSLSAIFASYVNSLFNERLRRLHREEQLSLLMKFVTADLKLLQKLDIHDTASTAAYGINILNDAFGDLQTIIMCVSQVASIISLFGGDHSLVTSVCAAIVAVMLEVISDTMVRKQIVSRHTNNYKQRSGEVPDKHEFYSKLLTYRIHGRDADVGKSALSVEWVDTTPSLYHTFVTEGTTQMIMQDLFFTITKRFESKQMLKEVMNVAPEFRSLYRSLERYRNRSFWMSAACAETLRRYTPTIDNNEPNRVRLPADCTPDLRVSDVNFAFSEKHQILHNVTFDIPFGSHVGIVGPSGCGKSTLLKLLTRLYDPTSGTISLGGKDLREIEVAHLRRELVTPVCDDSEILETTIMDNIKLGKPDSTREEVRAVLEVVNALSFVDKAGLGAKLGWGGVELSSGQCARLLLARTLLSKPKILLLDEVSAHLDPATEDALRNYLNTLRGSTTIINVAHRLSFLRECDRVIVFNADGKLTDSGTHQELLSRSTWYATACEQQEVCSPRFGGSK